MERMQAVDVVSGQCYYLSVYEYLACVGLKSRGNAARGAGSAHCSVRVSGRESETSGSCSIVNEFVICKNPVI